jgi:hypothetical protein
VPFILQVTVDLLRLSSQPTHKLLYCRVNFFGSVFIEKVSNPLQDDDVDGRVSIDKERRARESCISSY